MVINFVISMIPLAKTIRVHGRAPVRGVIHVGAHLGQEFGQYHEDLLVPVERIIWIEADPDTAQCISAAHRDWRVIQAVIAEHDDEEIIFNVASNGGQSSSILPLGTHMVRHPGVHFVGERILQTAQLGTVLQAHSLQLSDYNLITMDIQGAEMKALRGMGALLYSVDYLLLEVTTEELYVGCSRIEEIDAFVHLFGFVRVATHMTENNWGDAFYVRRGSQTIPPARELRALERKWGHLMAMRSAPSLRS